MGLSICFDKYKIPCNSITIIVVGIIGFSFVTIGRVIPDGILLSMLSMLFIMIGWVCYLITLIGICTVIFRAIFKQPCSPKSS